MEVENALSRLNTSGFDAGYRPQRNAFIGWWLDISIRDFKIIGNQYAAGYFEIERGLGQWLSRVANYMCICVSPELDVAINAVIGFFGIVKKLGKTPFELSLLLYACQKSEYNISVVSDQEIILLKKVTASEKPVEIANTESDLHYIGWKTQIKDKGQCLLTRLPAPLQSEESIYFSTLEETIDHILNEQDNADQNDRSSD